LHPVARRNPLCLAKLLKTRDRIWRGGWDSNPAGLFRIGKLQILQCQACRECQRCRGALHAVARSAEFEVPLTDGQSRAFRTLLAFVLVVAAAKLVLTKRVAARVKNLDSGPTTYYRPGGRAESRSAAGDVYEGLRWHNTTPQHFPARPNSRWSGRIRESVRPGQPASWRMRRTTAAPLAGRQRRCKPGRNAVTS
jgi:hypothetical protein